MLECWCKFEHNLSYQPPLGPAVLKPGFDLCVCHLQALRQSCPLGAGQVLLPVEAFLQLADLNSGKGSPGLFPFRRSPVLVRVSYPSRNCERHQSGCREETLWWVGDFTQRRADWFTARTVWKFKAIITQLHCYTALPCFDWIRLVRNPICYLLCETSLTKVSCLKQYSYKTKSIEILKLVWTFSSWFLHR